MQQGGEPDETRRFEGPGGPGEPDATRRMEGPDGPDAQLLGDRYRLAGWLGAGGMADVHRATDLRLNRLVAVKIFRPGTDSDGERRFHEEARLLANLSHPGLVAVHDYGVEQHRAYLVTELVDGWSLREVLEQQRLPAEEVARIGTDLADVLAYVHEQGVVHRDVKPSNVLLGRDGRVRLADFGISRLVGASGLTAEDTTLGTASYMAPEQVHGDRVGPPADVYALGLVLLEAVTGYVEYPGGDWEAAAERLSRAPLVPDDLPARLRRALRVMTEADPARRPTAAQAAAMLGRVTAGEAVVEPPERSHATRYMAVALGVLALVAVIAAAVVAAEDEPGVAQPGVPPSATDEPAAEDPSGEDPSGEDPAGEGGPGFPDLPSFDAPDLPDLPEVPDSVSEDAKNVWERFKEWMASWF